MQPEDHVSREGLTTTLATLQQETSARPYSILHRLKLAKAYQALGYPDLAIGDAYKALLLIDEVVQEGEYHDESLEAAEADFLTEQIASAVIDTKVHTTSIENQALLAWLQGYCSKEAYVSWIFMTGRCETTTNLARYELLIQCLLDCDCLRSAFEFVSRAKSALPAESVFQMYDQRLSGRLQTSLEAKGESIEHADVEDYPDRGLVRREQYPWNHHEPDRFSDECLHFLNEELSSVAPKLEVKASELPVLTSGSSTKQPSELVSISKQLGLFAKEDVSPGKLILEERSLLTAISRLHDSYCDACSILLPGSQESTAPEADDSPIMACEECEEVFFCGQTCHDLAQESYHPSLCGVSVEQGKIPAKEASDHLYSLLLVRALALAETQDVHPLELKEVRYIWGDYHNHDVDAIGQPNNADRTTDAFKAVPRTLPFSFKSNILMPLHVLEKMDVNIFTRCHRYDTWIFNTLYAKFRGTASAKQGRDGRPEISAVHPLWCLANHSCDPNVCWEWQGAMRFWTREELVDWKGREPDQRPGLKRGDEVFGHYCDIRLPVKERREWAVGALGGDCMCARCIWEDKEG